MDEFKPTIEHVINEVKTYKIDGKPYEISYEQAEQILDEWFCALSQMFCDFINSQVLEGEILNGDDDE